MLNTTKKKVEKLKPFTLDAATLNAGALKQDSDWLPMEPLLIPTI